MSQLSPDFLGYGAFALADLLRRRELTSTELVDACIARIEQVNPKLNAVVVKRYDLARQEAAAADRQLAKGADDAPPLLGVPCTVKDTFALAGFPQTAGAIHRRNQLPAEDAVATARTRAAGAIPLGVTNVPEMAMWMESVSPLYGRTSNPYDPRRTSGGSSGGEAAIIAAAGSPFGIGSDIGGSIRMPAFFCGIFGHKPTGGMVPLAGHYPESLGQHAYYCAAGPMSRRAEDLMPLLRLVAGPDGSQYVRPFDLGDPNSVRFDQLEVLTCENFGGLPTRPGRDLQRALSQAADALQQRGATVSRWHHPALRKAGAIWSAMLSAVSEAETFHDLISPPGRRVNLLFEFGRLILGRERHTAEAIALALLEKVIAKMPGPVDALISAGAELRDALQNELAAGKVLLVPPHPRVAPKHKRPRLFPFDWAYTAIFNVLELPVSQAPIGFDSAGLPLGVQIVGPHGQDHIPIACAIALEQDFGGWRAPALS